MKLAIPLGWLYVYIGSDFEIQLWLRKGPKIAIIIVELAVDVTGTFLKQCVKKYFSRIKAPPGIHISFLYTRKIDFCGKRCILKGYHNFKDLIHQSWRMYVYMLRGGGSDHSDPY